MSHSVTKLQEHLDFSNGRSSPPRHFAAPYPVYGANGVIGNASEANSLGQSLVIGRVGSYCGSVYYSQKDAWVTDNAIKAKAKNEPETRFWYYVLGALNLNQFREGSGQPLINQSILNNIEVSIPEQTVTRQAIAHILGTLDDKIELNRKMNETLEAIARVLFKSWFVDFDPVRKKQAGQPTGLPAELDALFPGEFEDSALGDGSTALTAGIPKGWRVGNIYEICDVIYGAPFQSKLFNTENNGKPLVRIRDLKDEQPGVYTPEIHPKGYLIQPGDLLVGMDGEFRSYLWGSEPAWLNQRVCCFVPKFGISTLFLQHTIDPQLHFIEATEVATTVIHLGKGDIDNFKSLLPPMEVQKQFSQMADAIRAKILVNKSGLRVLSQLRDTLLPKLISGELRVKDTERFVGGVV